MDLDPSVLWDFAEEIVGTFRPRAATVRATVTRIDPDGTVWAKTADGGEAPASSVGAGVAVGDEVSLAWDGAQMSVTANVSSPPPSGRATREGIAAARVVADGARRIADAVGQHFFADDNGVHVTEEAGKPDTEHNILVNAFGVLIRNGKVWRSAFTDTATAFYDGLGNTAANIVARFGSDGAIIGYVSGVHVRIKDWYGMRMYDASDLIGALGTDIYGRFGVHGEDSACLDTKLTGEGTRSAVECEQYHATMRAVADTDEEGAYTRASITCESGPYPDAPPTIAMTVTGNADSSGDAEDWQTNTLTMNSKLVTTTSRFFGAQDCKLLWSGGYYMSADHTVTLSEHVAEQPHGIVLVWSGYASGAVQNYDWNCIFIPKGAVANHNGNGFTCVLSAAAFARVGVKYVHVNENFASSSTITGDASNVRSGTASGITYNNALFVLREVWGV